MGVLWRICISMALFVVLDLCTAQNATVCNMASSCMECISVGPACAWCTDREFSSSSCDLASTLESLNCTDVQNPENNFNVTKNESLSNTGEVAVGQAVQVQPQEIHMKIRKGDTERVRMHVKQAEDYPVDLYFLLDLTGSMGTYLGGLQTAANNIVAKMNELTSDFRVGYGSFIDKGVIPFANQFPNGTINVNERCESEACDAPYLFRNRLTLTDDSTLFEGALGSTILSGSQDSPEAGFDGLLQVATCQDIIGWRENAHNLVVYMSDAMYHTAGDGRMGGIVKPNDGLCHVDPSTGLYTIDESQDYPSLGQVSSLIKEKDISVLFAIAVLSERYRNLLPYFPGSEVRELSANSERLVNAVEEFYNSIRSQVSLSIQAPEEIVLDVTANCSPRRQTGPSTCSALQVGDEVYFDIDVTAESCIEGGSTSISISPVGFHEELRINVEVICECACQEQGIPNSPECNNNGTDQCGTCVCNAGRYGDECQCSGESSTAGNERLACVAPGSSAVCSGRGECICGDCVCNKQDDPTHVVSGEFCQCDNFTCPLFEGQLCGGPTRGRCECDSKTQQSKCHCKAQYEGDSCNCLKSQEACIAPNGLICNSHGTCSCGACRCEINSPFKGPTCSDCATCAGQCEVYQECVQCKAFDSGPLTEEECNMCTVEVRKVDSFPDVDYPYNCSVTHTDNCSIVFIPHFVNGEDSVPVIYVLAETICPPGPYSPGVDARWVAVGLAIAIVLIGIILIIIYKCYITWLDRKEYKEWEREKANAQFNQNENPLYKPASTVHKNPAFGTTFSDNEDSPALPDFS
ncbi:integrin beta-1-like [Lytechinus pictus]|uniref:integrin beta-1-like n=1 Tax=Lytechinus pictus TaxID=7653 RepID=UPI0030B9C8BB